MANSKNDEGIRFEVHAHAETEKSTSVDARKDSSAAVDVVGALNSIARQQAGSPLLYFGGCLVLSGLVGLVCFAPALCPLAFLGFVATCLPYRVFSFTKRKWAFFLVDYCYFANLAAAAFFVWAPGHAGWEAAVYGGCEGPLAGALVAWQCAWVMGSPDHIITVLMHSLPGLALFCHRYLSHTRQPLQLAAAMAAQAGLGRAAAGTLQQQQACAYSVGGGDAAAVAAAAAVEGGAGGLAATAAGLGGPLRRLAAVAGVARGRVPCGGDLVGALAAGQLADLASAAGSPTAAAAAVAAGGGGARVSAASAAAGATARVCSSSGGMATGARSTAMTTTAAVCYAAPLPPTACPSPAWLWLAAAPLLSYLAWQLAYFVIVQVCCRRLILARGYDTSYRSLARRAQRSGSVLNRIVRRGGIARRLFMYGLLQFLFTLATLGLAVATYYSFEAAAAWQLVKFLLPLYLGAVHVSERAPAQELRAAAVQMAAVGLLAAPAAEALHGAADAGKKRK
ncbi:hypothetical protein HYH02_007426 [Chlamydomonas schloesseri]|uniref:Glycerophosphocholine acyltransferase 1 n=1 Tax=Chlamydomonas schloesseri TaxID=2026947 RepID=A0A836B4N1_9CHLO|nr:hypothetical protein HYH02_007426 [Chlamydomonas schloesseri]|eukprot:KAG2447500.1 hypothetical protein HYH02_007426 [Chlamydomonas schloesseri]